MKHQMDQGNQDPVCTAFGKDFVVLAHSSVSADPGERTLRDPSLAQHGEANDVVASLDDVQDPTAERFRPGPPFSCVAAVGPDLTNAIAADHT